MKNPFKENSLASGLFGFILGLGVMFGGQQLFPPDVVYEQDTNQTKEQLSDNSENSDQQPEEIVNSEIVCTPNGKCFHFRTCGTLSNSKQLIPVTKESVTIRIKPTFI